MGSRSLTAVYSGGTHRVAQYSHYYGAGHGLRVLDFARKNLVTEADRAKFAACLDRCRFVGVGPDRPAQRWDLSGPFVLEFIRQAVGEVDLFDSLGFAQDSLFCEWAYVLDLDTRRLEVFRGFQEQPHKEGRFAQSVGAPRERKVVVGKPVGYYPVKLVAWWDLEDLPRDESFSFTMGTFE